MFGKIAAFEFRYQLRQPVFWVVAIVFFLLTFGSVTIDQIQIGSGGNVYKNAPYAIAQTTAIWTLFYMFVTTAFAANVVVRDTDTGFGPIIQATRIRKFDYLFGRFVGAFGAVALCFAFVPLALFLGSLMWWLDPETLGPNRLWNYAFAYLVIGIPGLLLTSSVFFALATVTRSMMLTYVGVAAFFILYFIATAALSRPEFEDVMAYAEPFGIAAYGLATQYWTAAERNTLIPPLEGALLWNRVIWLGVSVAFLALAYVLFRFETRGAKLKKAETLKARADAAAPAVVAAGPLPRPSFGFSTALAQLVARTRFEMGQVFKSPAFFILLTLGVINSAAGLWFSNEMYGAQIYPVTRTMIAGLTGAFSLIPIIVAIYYAGELVWRERERKTHEIIDSTPLPDWAFVVPKSLALALVLVATLLVSVVTAVLVQTLKGWFDFELGKYLLWYVLPQAIDWTLLAVLAIFVQAISPHKFLGWGLMVLYIIAGIVFSQIGLEHNLLVYGGAPNVPLSDMNGQGRFWIGATWFRAFWTAAAILLLVLSHGLWRRGTETRILPRLRRLPHRLAGPAGVLGGLAVVAMIGVGGFIFVNTNVWNDYETSKQGEARQAAYEKALLRYEDRPQPSIVSVTLDVDIHPHEPRLDTTGSYLIENRTGAPLQEMHLRWMSPNMEMLSLAIDGARLAREYEDFDYRIYRFDTPMAPGEQRTVRFETRIAQRGFRNGGNITNVVDNGSFVNNTDLAPLIGMARSGLLQDRATRRRHGLPAELRDRDLDDAAGRAHNYVRADWVQSDITVTTVADQTPIAPGYKVSDSTAEGRRTARFVSEAPILHFFSVQSARYEVTTETYRDVELAIYHDARHAWNVDRMITALKAGLDYFEDNFGEYQFRQARILEFPDYARFAQAFANTMPYSEGIGFIADFRDPEKIDYVTYVTAHELAHQWWAHQVISADVQGAEALSETLSQYSALMVMEKLYGPERIRRFLKYELNSYLRARGGEVLEELPLYRVENQGYIHYRKGALVMYLLRDQMGEAAVNRALRSLVQQFAFGSAPYPTSRDLIAALRAQAGPEHQELITDLFERITLYDVKATQPQVRRLREGRWEVTFTIEARKLYADGKGVESETPLNEVFDIGVFTARPGDGEFDRDNVLIFERRPIRSGSQTVTFYTREQPRFVGVDPYNKRIDRNADDNVVAVGG